MSWHISKDALAHLNNGAGTPRASQPGTSARPAFDAGSLKKYEGVGKFKGGLEVYFRPIRPEDEPLLKELFYSHSAQTILHRYFAPIHDLSPDQVRRFVAVDYRKDFALVGMIPRDGGERMIGVARYYRCGETREAEVAVTMHDQYQNLGIGTYLTRALIKIAMERGITMFRASVLADNHAMMHVFHKMADKVEVDHEAGIYELRFALSEQAWPKEERP